MCALWTLWELSSFLYLKHTAERPTSWLSSSTTPRVRQIWLDGLSERVFTQRMISKPKTLSERNFLREHNAAGDSLDCLSIAKAVNSRRKLVETHELGLERQNRSSPSLVVFIRGSKRRLPQILRIIRADRENASHCSERA